MGEEINRLREDFWKYVLANDKKVVDLVKDLELAKMKIENLQIIVYDHAVLKEEHE